MSLVHSRIAAGRVRDGPERGVSVHRVLSTPTRELKSGEHSRSWQIRAKCDAIEFPFRNLVRLAAATQRPKAAVVAYVNPVIPIWARVRDVEFVLEAVVVVRNAQCPAANCQSDWAVCRDVGGRIRNDNVPWDRGGGECRRQTRRSLNENTDKESEHNERGVRLSDPCQPPLSRFLYDAALDASTKLSVVVLQQFSCLNVDMSMCGKMADL